MLDNKILFEIEKKIVVSDDPFPNTIVEDFLPINIVQKAEKEFVDLNATVDAGSVQFQKTKKVLYDYSKMPITIKQIINFLYSDGFLHLLEKKFGLKNLLPDWNLFGGGLHQSFKGGFLKVHSDFIYMRKSKLKRRLNLLLYLNSNWDANWGGAIEFWDTNMSSAQRTFLPKINNTVIFRTDLNSNHGFPEPIKCPDNISRKSLALYYYTKEKSLFPITIRRRKHFHAVWKKRPNKDEPKFGDNDPLFKRLKHRFFYRFF